MRIIRELLEYKPQSQKTNISNALEFLSGVMKKKAIVFMMSDFMDSGYEKTLRIVAKKHDLTGIRIYDRHEENMPNIGLVPMLDNETGQIAWVNTQSPRYEKLMQINIILWCTNLKTFSIKMVQELCTVDWIKAMSKSC